MALAGGDCALYPCPSHPGTSAVSAGTLIVRCGECKGGMPTQGQARGCRPEVPRYAGQPLWRTHSSAIALRLRRPIWYLGLATGYRVWLNGVVREGRPGCRGGPFWSWEHGRACPCPQMVTCHSPVKVIPAPELGLVSAIGTGDWARVARVADEYGHTKDRSGR